MLCLQHPYCAVRHLAARCLGVLSNVSTQETMRVVVEGVLPLMGTADLVRNRQGALEAISCIFFNVESRAVLKKKGKRLFQVAVDLAVLCYFGLQ